jgi:hypothetical protein
MQRIVLLLLCFISLSGTAQNLSGIWRGHFKSGNFRNIDTILFDDRYKFETQIDQKDKFFEGVTYSYRSTMFYGKASCFGSISTKTKKVILGENKLLEVKSENGDACLMTCFLQYSKVGEEELLEGTYTSISTRDSSQCGTGTVFLRKVQSSDFYKEPFLVEKGKTAPQVKKPQPVPLARKTTPAPVKKSAQVSAPKKPIAASRSPKVVKAPAKPALKKADIKNHEALKQLNPDTFKTIIPKNDLTIAIPQVLAERENELVKTITSSSKEIFIKIYDNGTIDNDTVSVYVDKKLVLSKQRLTDKALMLKINLDLNTPVHELVMVAENLGEIPPNTSLMVVTAGEEQYEVRITSTEQKNAVVRFAYRQ